MSATSPDPDLAYSSALDLARRVRSREVSPVELVDCYLDRIERFDPAINAFITVVADQARSRAVEAERAMDPAGAFHGVPIAIKDLTDTAAIRSTHGTAAWAERIPDRDAAVVARIRRAGFIIIGKTNVPEFGLLPICEPPAYGPCRNPWDLGRTPGGSSGGAAAALAAGMCPIAHGSDFGGSVRSPASVCGVVGLKPSRGRVSQAPARADLLSQHGPMARTVHDVAALLDVMAGYETGDAWSAPAPGTTFLAATDAAPRRLRIAFCTTPFAEDIECARANAAVVHDTARLLESLGHDVSEREPGRYTEMLPPLTTLIFANAAARPGLPAMETLDPWTAMLVGAGREKSATDLLEAMSALDAVARQLVAFFDDLDVLITPTVAAPPPPIGSVSGHVDIGIAVAVLSSFVPFTAPWNVTGQPAMSLPLGTDDLGLPVGVQLVGRPFDEATLLGLARQLECASPWIDRRPTLTAAT